MDTSIRVTGCMTLREAWDWAYLRRTWNVRKACICITGRFISKHPVYVIVMLDVVIVRKTDRSGDQGCSELQQASGSVLPIDPNLHLHSPPPSPAPELRVAVPHTPSPPNLLSNNACLLRYSCFRHVPHPLKGTRLERSIARKFARHCSQHIAGPPRLLRLALPLPRFKRSWALCSCPFCCRFPALQSAKCLPHVSTFVVC